MADTADSSATPAKFDPTWIRQPENLELAHAMGAFASQLLAPDTDNMFGQAVVGYMYKNFSQHTQLAPGVDEYNLPTWAMNAMKLYLHDNPQLRIHFDEAYNRKPPITAGAKATPRPESYLPDANVVAHHYYDSRTDGSDDNTPVSMDQVAEAGTAAWTQRGTLDRRQAE